MQDNDTSRAETPSERIAAMIASWPNVTVEDGQFGSTSFQLAGSEFGHLHPRLADIGYPRPLRDQLIAEGRTEAHHAVPRHPMATTFRIGSADDIDHVVWLFRLSYLARVARLQREGTEAVLPEIDVPKELDELAPSDAVRNAFEAAVAT